MPKKRTSSNSGRGNIVVLSKHKAYKAAKQQATQSHQRDTQYSSKAKVHTARILDGRLLVEHFDDGTRRMSIVGIYRREPVRAMSDAIGLTVLARQLWQTTESESPDNT